MNQNVNLPLDEFFTKFPDDSSAENWVVKIRWPNGILCPHCGSSDVNEKRANGHHKVRRWNCRDKDCRKTFTSKSNHIFHGSKFGMQTWLLAIHLFMSSNEGYSSSNLAEQVGIKQTSMWFMLHRIRHAMGQIDIDSVHKNDVGTVWDDIKNTARVTYRKETLKHLDRYANEHLGRLSFHGLTWEERIIEIVRLGDGIMLSKKELTEDNGLDNGLGYSRKMT